MNCFTLLEGSSPLLISMPHVGLHIPKNIEVLMGEEALKLKDTDWFIDKLYGFAHHLGATVIKPEASRYVIDLNRGIDGVNLYPGANSTELCPSSTFNNTPIYSNDGQVTPEEVDKRIAEYWLPYHEQIKQTLAKIKEKFGFVILLDAHSILSEVPRFFDGRLPDFNWGTANGESCSKTIVNAIKEISYSPYSVVWNGRFKGGYITRHYGDPDNNIHAIQLELSQRTYMNENQLAYSETLAGEVSPILKSIINKLIHIKPDIIKG